MSDPTTRAIQQILFDDNSLRVTLKKLSEDMGGAEKAMPYVVMAFMRATLDNPIWAGVAYGRSLGSNLDVVFEQVLVEDSA